MAVPKCFGLVNHIVQPFDLLSLTTDMHTILIGCYITEYIAIIG